MKENSADVKEIEEKPPLFRTWKAWYLLTIGNLIFLIMLFYFFTRYYS